MKSLFPNTLHVARREYLIRVRGRTFLISTALIAIVVLLVTLVPTIAAAFGGGDPLEIGVAVEADDLATDPVADIQALLIVAADPNTDPTTAPPSNDETDPDDRPRVTRVTDADAAADQVRDDELDALLTITRADDGDLEFEYLGSASPTNQTRLLVTQAATVLAIGDRLERSGIGQEEASEFFAPPEFTAVPVDPDDAQDADGFAGAFVLAYALVILTFGAILTYGNWVAQSVAEEKSGRVMELLITAATPRQLLAGKVLGTGAAGLTQYAAVIGALIIGFLANGPISSAIGVSGELPFQLPSLEPLLIVPFSAFFVFGFLLYATLYAAAGSMVSRIEDVQQAVGPLLFLAMGGYFASFAALNAPDAGWVAVLSFVPFFSPYLMPVRILLTSVGPAEIAVTIALLVVSVAIAMWVAARIYSVGVLMYGQRAGIRAILRATRVSR